MKDAQKMTKDTSWIIIYILSNCIIKCMIMQTNH